MKRRNTGLFVLALALAITVWFASPAVSQDKPADNMDILLEKIRADKKLLVAANMELTESEAKAFWPLYQKYQDELFLLRARTARLIKDYAEASKDMKDEKAKDAPPADAPAAAEAAPAGEMTPRRKLELEAHEPALSAAPAPSPSLATGPAAAKREREGAKAVAGKAGMRLPEGARLATLDGAFAEVSFSPAHSARPGSMPLSPSSPKRFRKRSKACSKTSKAASLSRARHTSAFLASSKRSPRKRHPFTSRLYSLPSPSWLFRALGQTPQITFPRSSLLPKVSHTRGQAPFCLMVQNRGVVVASRNRLQVNRLVLRARVWVADGDSQ